MEVRKVTFEGRIVMEIRIHDGSGDNAWANGWTRSFGAALPARLETASIHLHVSGRSQASLQIRHRDLATLCTMNVHRTDEPERKAADYAEWFLSEEQTALFREAQSLRDEPVTVERAAALAVASRIDGAAFRDAMLSVLASSTAKCKKGRANIKTGLNAVTPHPGIAIRAREGQPPLVRVRDKAFRLSDLNYTPQVDMHLPQVMVDAIAGRPFDGLVEHAAMRGEGFIVERVSSVAGNGRNPSRTTFHLRSDRIDLDEAAALIDERRRDMTPAAQGQGK